MYPYGVLGKIGLYDILMAAGVLIAFVLADKLGVKRGFSLALQRILIVGFVIAIALGYLGAVLFQAFYDFMKTGVFKLGADTGMTFYGGLIFGAGAFLLVWFIGGKLFCKDGEAVKRFGGIAAIAGCLIPLAHGFGRLGCFFAGCCHGKVTTAWYGVEMLTENGWQKVVPVQLYEAAFLFLLAAGLFCLFFKYEGKRRLPLLALYAVAYGVWRFFIEYARADDRGATVVAFLSPSQLVALLMIVAGTVYFCVRFFGKRTEEKKEKIKNNK